VSPSSYYVDDTDMPRRRLHWLARLGMLVAVIVAVALIGTMAAVGAGRRPHAPAAPAAYPSAEPPLPSPAGSAAVPDGRAPGAGAPDGGAPGGGAPGGGAPGGGTPTQSTKTIPAKPPPEPTGLSAAEAAVFMIVNQERANAGCAPLTVDSRLTTAARRHSADMAQRGYFDHTTPEGVEFATRITQAGYRWSTAGENIAKGQPTAASVMKAWMNSKGHRANILNCKYRNIGIGLAYSPRREPVWTQDFATPMR
jgi:uncharacterized protein YkwD